ncbi:MAG: Nif3-like dinuclear metal center hexameric protein [Planctomycetota bacterium]
MARSLTSLVTALDAIAPIRLAADWDRVGLLVEPTSAAQVATVLCAIDLTEPVLDEALEIGAGLIVAYHPLIFRGLAGLRASRPDERTALRCAERGLAVYSPHTAWDAVEGGATDWLSDGLDLPSTRSPIEPDASAGDPAGGDVLAGHGRLLRLETPARLDDLIPRIKSRLGLDRLRIAQGRRAEEIRTIAVCPGAGSSVLEQVADADLWWTGEMRHHDVLAARARGTSVILSEHSLTERGSLARLADRLRELCPDLKVCCSTADRDPLEWA